MPNEVIIKIVTNNDDKAEHFSNDSVVVTSPPVVKKDIPILKGKKSKIHCRRKNFGRASIVVKDFELAQRIVMAGHYDKQYYCTWNYNSKNQIVGRLDFFLKDDEIQKIVDEYYAEKQPIDKNKTEQ